MRSFLSYVFIIVPAISGIFALFFNTTKDTIKTSPFNKLSPAGWVALVFILLFLIFSCKIHHDELLDQDIELTTLRREKHEDSVYKNSLIKEIIENKELSINQFKSQTDLLKNETNHLSDKLSMSADEINTLKGKNDLLNTNLNQQMEVTYVSLLNQTIVNPQMNVIIDTKYTFANNNYTEYIANKHDSIVGNSLPDQYLSTNNREIIFPKYESFRWMDGRYVIFKFSFEIPDIWDVDINIFNDGASSIYSHYRTETETIATLYDNVGSISTFDHKMKIISKQLSKINAAVLYRNLKSAEEVFSLEYIFPKNISDERVNNILNDFKNKVSSMHILIPVNGKAGLGFVIPLKFSSSSINNNQYYKTGKVSYRIIEMPKLSVL